MGTSRGSVPQVPDPERQQEPAADPAWQRGQQAGQAEGSDRRPGPGLEPWDDYSGGSQDYK
eukprot:15278290-Heterocapsa_arctica.AAC.1